MKIFINVLMSLFVVPVFAEPTFINILSSRTQNFDQSTHHNTTHSVPADSPFRGKKDLMILDFTQVKEWTNPEDLATAFQTIRDLKIFSDPEIIDFKRRIPWLYYIDGCFTRAGLSSKLLKSKGYPEVSLVYVFGKLHLRSKNIFWGYHVAPAVRLNDEVYVFDIAINPERPITFQEWVSEFSLPNQPLKGNICAAAAWDTNYSCTNEDFDIRDVQYGNTLNDWNNMYWLPNERRFLGEKAEEFLGEQPPWLKTNLSFKIPLKVVTK